jgi:nucleoside-diphosphate-sugar epimerase
MESDQASGEVVNLGNPTEHTILEYAKMIRELASSNSEVIFTPYAVGDDPQRRRPDITKAREILSWEPSVGLEDGLSQTVEYFRSEIMTREAMA